MTYSLREKLGHFNRLKDASHLEADLEFLKKLEPKHGLIKKGSSSKKIYQEEVLYVLLDVATACDIKEFRRGFNKSDEEKEAEAAETERLRLEAEAKAKAKAKAEAAETERLRLEAEAKAKADIEAEPQRLAEKESDLNEKERKLDEKEQGLDQKEQELDQLAEKKSVPKKNTPK